VHVDATALVAIGYESVIREKELASDALLSATEIVRRCERRVGELVRQGQEEGTIAGRGDVGRGRTPHLSKPSDIVPNDEELRAARALAAAGPDEFDQAVDQARQEGNLSRANVVRKIRGRPSPLARATLIQV
jgi:hypothetical protein